MSFQSELKNLTPFSAGKYVLPDIEGQEVVLVIVAATFEAPVHKGLRIAEIQQPLHVADEYHGDPAFSSIRYESDVAIEKPYVDVLVSGSAYAPGSRPAAAVPIQISVGDIRKDLIVSGDRFWRPGPLGLSPSSPQPFDTMPILYERAFGGMIEDAGEARNLVGIGFRGARSHDPDVRTEVPNIEYPGARMLSKSDRPEPAGFHVVGRGWQPRLRYAGTFDQEWQEQQWPLLPQDFDSRFNQSAPVDQQSRAMRGGELVRLVNMTPEGEWQFVLPQLSIPMLSLYDDRKVETTLRFDTVLIEPDAFRVTLTSRTAITTKRLRGLLREIVLGHASPGWLRSRMTGKKYVDGTGRNGALPPDRHYVL